MKLKIYLEKMLRKELSNSQYKRLKNYINEKIQEQINEKTNGKDWYSILGFDLESEQAEKLQEYIDKATKKLESEYFE